MDHHSAYAYTIHLLQLIRIEDTQKYSKYRACIIFVELPITSHSADVRVSIA